MHKAAAFAAGALLALVSMLAPVGAVESAAIEPFIQEGGIRDVRISPDGKFLAMTMRVDGQTGLMIVPRGQTQASAVMRFARDTHAHDFVWVNSERVLISLAETFGTRDDPVPTGELFAMNADGSRKQLLVGYRATGRQTGTRIGVDKEGRVAAFPVGLLPDDDRHVLVKVMPLGNDPYSRLERLNVYDGRRTRLAPSPVANADFVTDHQGRVRFAVGNLADNYSQLFHRRDDSADWEQLNHEQSSGRVERPLGFAEGDTIAYLRVSQRSGPDRIVALDTATGERRDVMGDAVVDPIPVYSPTSDQPIGAWYLGATPRLAFIDEEHPEAKLQRMLERAFPGMRMSMRAATHDGKLRVVLVDSDVDPGTFYLFDAATANAEMIVVRDRQIDSTRMARMQPIELEARDGLKLHGFITLPPGAEPRSLPMVVMPHGGPFGLFDAWGFDADAQLLAASGYAVLQVNFRGSGNYGRAFRQAGARQWGATMQDDVTDATRWAIAEGYADPHRVCIYGVSYGAYAALMGSVREPDLYRCAIGYVGVYDLPKMVRDDIDRSRSTATWLREWIGTDPAALEAASPTARAGEIKVPVFLAAGGEDHIAPIEHTRRMESALKRAGVPVEALYYPKEGHGFYDVAHRREFYSRVLRFLAAHTGPRPD